MDRVALPAPPAKVGLLLAMGSMTMIFAALASAYLVRMGMGGWTSVHAGSVPLLWANTVLLIATSVFLETGRRRAREGGNPAAVPALRAATVLGTTFLAGQALAWRELAAAGLILVGDPAAGFFYLITGVHGLHIVGGIGALLLVIARVRRASKRRLALAGADDPETGPLDSDTLAIELAGTYWHFLLVTWLVLFGLMAAT